jgi:hypothetical protein
MIINIGLNINNNKLIRLEDIVIFINISMMYTCVKYKVNRNSIMIGIKIYKIY